MKELVVQESSAADEKYRGWKRAIIWSGLIVGSWVLVIEFVSAARSALA